MFFCIHISRCVCLCGFVVSIFVRCFKGDSFFALFNSTNLFSLMLRGFCFFFLLNFLLTKLLGNFVFSSFFSHFPRGRSYMRQSIVLSILLLWYMLRLMRNYRASSRISSSCSSSSSSCCCCGGRFLYFCFGPTFKALSAPFSSVC